MRICSARWVIPIDRPPIADGALALADDGTVAAVGARAEIRAAHPDAPEERAHGALVPGLVNAHCHLELSPLADAVPGGEGLLAWVGKLMPANRKIGAEQRRDDAASAAEAAVRFGTAGIGDVGTTLDAAAGIGRAGMCGTLFHELLGSRDVATGDALADAAREKREADAEGRWPAQLGWVPAPHAPYSASPDLLRRIFAAAAAAGHTTSIHVAEDPDELALLADGSGRWPAVLEGMGIDPRPRVSGRAPVATLAGLGAFDGPSPPLLVHMVHASAEDRGLAREAGATVVLCPRSNLHIGGELPDVTALLADGVRLALGTDSLASAPDLSPWAEMATLAAHFPSVPAGRWLQAATRDGARALGLSALGTFTPGKRPGVVDVLIDDAAAPLESLVRDPHPSLRWVARSAA
jgi:cytosine/adenosine deaminase-related metal-dependent hydrolase